MLPLQKWSKNVQKEKWMGAIFPRTKTWYYMQEGSFHNSISLDQVKGFSFSSSYLAFCSALPQLIWPAKPQLLNPNGLPQNSSSNHMELPFIALLCKFFIIIYFAVTFFFLFGLLHPCDAMHVDTRTSRRIQIYFSSMCFSGIQVRSLVWQPSSLHTETYPPCCIITPISPTDSRGSPLTLNPTCL